VDDARSLMKHIDPSLGKPLPEKDYGGNCRVYDSENLTDPFHNVWVTETTDFLHYKVLNFKVLGSILA